MTDALTQEQVREILEDLYQAEDAVHDAFRAVLEQWPRAGLPTNPRAWLVSAGRFQTIDAPRKRGLAEANCRMTGCG